MTPLPLDVDVAIVGAGPTGLALAIGLAQRGVDFVILDALPEAQNTSRAAVIHAGTMEALRKLEIADDLIEAGIKVRNFRIRERSKVLLRSDFGVLKSPTPYALMIPQDESEVLMTAKLSSLGHQVQRPHRVVAIERHSKGAILTTDDGSRIQARFVVGADGEKSTVRTQTNIPFPGETYGSFMLADVRMAWPIAKDEVTLFFSREGTLVVAHVSEVLWGSRFQVHHKLADRSYQAPVILMGDAAHVHSPAGGQGMNLGLKDAVALADALQQALESGNDRPLETYAQTRRAAAENVLHMTDRLSAVATLQNRPLRIARNILIRSASAFPFIRRRVARTLSGTEETPRRSR